MRLLILPAVISVPSVFFGVALNVKVTVDVSPICKATSLNVIATVGPNTGWLPAASAQSVVKVKLLATSLIASVADSNIV